MTLPNLNFGQQPGPGPNRSNTPSKAGQADTPGAPRKQSNRPPSSSDKQTQDEWKEFRGAAKRIGGTIAGGLAAGFGALAYFKRKHDKGKGPDKP